MLTFTYLGNTFDLHEQYPEDDQMPCFAIMEHGRVTIIGKVWHVQDGYWLADCHEQAFAAFELALASVLVNAGY